MKSVRYKFPFNFLRVSLFFVNSQRKIHIIKGIRLV